MTAGDLELLHSEHVPDNVGQRGKNAVGLQRAINKNIKADRRKVRGPNELQDHRNTPDDWSSWDVFRLVDYVIHNNMEDWAVVIEICNKLGQNDEATQESFRVLVDNIRSSFPTVQLLAAKLWIIMIYRCKSYFADHLPRQLLLETIEDVALSSHTPPVVRDRLVEVVGASVFLLKGAQTFKFYQSTWMKLRQQLNLTYPAEGLAITADDPILSPGSSGARNRLSQTPPSEPIPPSLIPDSSTAEPEQDPGWERRDRLAEPEYERRLTRSPVLEPDSGSSVTSPMDDVWWLFEECETARGNCRILGDSLLHTTSDGVTKDPLIKEFHEKAVASIEIIDTHIDSVATKADSARARRHSGDPGNTSTRSVEEQLLQALVTTRVELRNVLATYDELSQLSKAKLSVDPEDVPISRQMDAAEVVSHLIAHGCADLSNNVDHSSFSDYPMSHGGFSDVFRGRLSDGTEVAMKLLRVSADSLGQHPKHLKHAARELHTWSKCSHPNVISLFGMAVFRGRIGMVSPWMSQGSLPHYLEQTPGADRHKLCVQICEGLSYLHQIGIIHGDMKGANVLISGNGTPVLTDFGNAFVADRTMKFTPTTSTAALTVRWSAVEIIEGTSQHTEASDVYALGMTLYEIISGKLPYHAQSDITVVLLVTIRKEPPDRPECLPIGHKDGDKLWSLLLRCWSYEPGARPSAAEAASEMKAIPLNDLLHVIPRP
ncbi:unnamed protein product [Rhizoctonia solani]|uniref:Uncharacterized protein n=1 Tax=Rhizoctonia solani TaxID=456999 RepID=A0A8H3HF64_9AGAM|nr:unnamed protein product [Rhizoctonia solani]